MLSEELFALAYFGNTDKQYLILIILIIGSLAFGKLVYLVFKNVFKILAKKTKSEFDDLLVSVLERPLLLLIVLIGFYVGYIQLTLPDDVEFFFDHVTKTLLTIAVVWFIIKLIDEVIEHYITPMIESSETDLDDHLVPLLKKLVNTTLVVIAVLIILSNFGVNVSSAVAGLGIGGLAVALAAQESLKNILAGITILADKPFKLGEWIEVDKFQGTVVEIGLRSTKLKTATGDLVTVPNSMIVSIPVTDYSRYKTKKIILLVSLAYDTPAAKIEKAKETIREHIEKAEKVVKESIEVTFVKISTSSLDIDARFEISTNNAAIIGKIKDSLNLNIKKSFEKEKISIAYPQAIQLKK
jgi:MscS family membrane protein